MARFVTSLRMWLPLLAVVLLLLLFAWPYVAPGFRLENIAKNIPDLVIENLHYTGVNSKNEPYAVSAAQATRPSQLQNVYDLVKPEGEITLDSGAWMDGKADVGRYDETSKQLWLGGNVRLFHNEGYQMMTEEAQINLTNNEAWGDKTVTIQGDFGIIRGVGFRYLDSGRAIIVRGPAKALLNLHKSSHSGK